MVKEKSQTKRAYPPFYERLVPIALMVIGLGILVLLVISLVVAMGVFPK